MKPTFVVLVILLLMLMHIYVLNYKSSCFSYLGLLHTYIQYKCILTWLSELIFSIAEVEWCGTRDVSKWIYWHCSVYFLLSLTTSPQIMPERSVPDPFIWWFISISKQWRSGFSCWELHGKISWRRSGPTFNRRGASPCS